MQNDSAPANPNHNADKSDVIGDLTGRFGAGRIYSFEDRDSLKREFEAISGSSCVFDCYAAYSLYEWLNDQGAIAIEGTPPATMADVLSSSDHRFAGFRLFARRFDPTPFVNRLILSETVYVNLYGFYVDNSDVKRLTSYGFFRQYPNPTGPELLGIYRLQKPQILSDMSSQLQSIPNLPPYEQLFKEPKTARYFEDYGGILSWLYDEEAKARCGDVSQEMGLFGLVSDQYYTFAGVLLDFIETALMFRGSQLAGAAPMASPLAGSRPLITTAEEASSEAYSLDALGLFQRASHSVLGVSPSVRSFEDVLRLREDRHIARIRALLGQYIKAVGESDDKIVEEIGSEISTAKHAIEQFKWRESPAYMFVVKPLSYMPVVGQIVGLINDGLDVIQYLRSQKHGWIYFGSR